MKYEQAFTLNEGNNLISFIGLNESDNSIETIFNDLDNNLTHIFTENYAAVLMDDGAWFGSLVQIDT